MENNLSKSFYLILYVIAGIIIWISVWQIASLLFDKYDKQTQIIIYSVGILLSILIIFVVGYNHPKILNMDT